VPSRLIRVAQAIGSIARIACSSIDASIVLGIPSRIAAGIAVGTHDSVEIVEAPVPD
jgi:hypothetical protein